MLKNSNQINNYPYWDPSIALETRVHDLVSRLTIDEKISLLPTRQAEVTRLGIKEYSNVNIHCCFNIYKRNESGLNKKPNYKLKDVKIVEYRRGSEKRSNHVNKEDFDYDIRICSWGNPVGKEVDYEEQYSTEFCIKIYNEQYKKQVINLLKNTVWEKIYLTVTHAGKLNQWQVYKYIKENIEGIA